MEAYQPKALMPFMKRVPAKRVVHLPEAARDPVEFSLSFNESLPLPQGISSTQLANYHVTGMPQNTHHQTLVSRCNVSQAWCLACTTWRQLAQAELRPSRAAAVPCPDASA